MAIRINGKKLAEALGILGWREAHEHARGEIYSLYATATNDLELDKICVNDGEDIVILLSNISSPKSTDGSVSKVVITYLEPISECAVISEMPHYPLLTTYGFADRPIMFDPKCPIFLPYLDKIWVYVENAESYGMMRIGHKKYKNYGNAMMGARAVVGGVHVTRQFLFTYDGYTEGTGVEVEKARIDTGAIRTYKKICPRFIAKIDVAQVGSFVKVYTSEDGKTWTERYSTGDLPTTATSFYPQIKDVKARYIRISANSADPAKTVTLQVFPLFAWALKE